MFGADFSGAKTPQIAYMWGELEGRFFHLEALVPCDDRMDLLGAVQYHGSAWALDFPFSLPLQTRQDDDMDWWNWLQMAFTTPREGFLETLRTRLACITLADVIWQHGFEFDWTQKPYFASSEEWVVTPDEGLIVRMDDKREKP